MDWKQLEKPLLTYSTINMYSLTHVYNLMLEITFKPFYTLYVSTHELETARKTISMTYSTINIYSSAHVYNVMLEI